MHKQESETKKYLLPSGSSGTLLRKESKYYKFNIIIVIEMDEVNSSSSSSIGKEQNVHLAL